MTLHPQMMMKEHRKYPRLPLTAKVRLVYTTGASLYALTRDINRGGMGLYSNSPIDEGTGVRLEVMFKDMRGRDLMEVVKGKVVFNYEWHWVYVAGVQFDQLLNSEETPYLLEYIENCERIINISEGKL